MKKKYSSIWWIRAETSSKIEESLQFIATQMKMMDAYRSPSAQVQAYVQMKLIENPGWLVIFDNATSPKSIQNIVPSTKEGGHILITTRNDLWSESHPIRIDAFTQKEAIDLLNRFNLIKDQRESAQELAKELGYLPLALTQAGRYLALHSATTYKNYLNLFRKRLGTLSFQDNEIAENQSRTTVAATWGMTMEKIAEKDHEALRIMYILAYLDPDGFSSELLKHLRVSRMGVKGKAKYVINKLSSQDQKPVIGEVIAENSLSLLRSYGIIGQDQEILSTHRLVQLVVQGHLITKKKEKDKKEQTVEMLKSLWKNSEKTGEEIAHFKNHVYAAIKHVQSDPKLLLSLLQLQSELNQDYSTTQGLDLYISPQCTFQPMNEKESLFDLDEEVTKFVNSKQYTDPPLLLLQGGAGTGKTLYARHLEKELWNGYFNSWITNPPLPLFISLSKVYDPKNPEEDVIAKTFIQHGLSESTTATLKDQTRNKKYVWIFIVDGFDEINGQNNIYTQGQMDTWQSKLIITCRSEYFQNNNYIEWFKVNEKMAHQLYIAPFTIDQVSKYIINFAKSSYNITGQSAKTYQREIERIPKLKEIMQTPFLLVLILQILPELLKKQNTNENNQITRYQIYEIFSHQWFKKEAHRLKEQRKESDYSEIDIQNILNTYACHLGFTMFATGIQTLSLSPVPNQNIKSDPKDLLLWEEFYKGKNAPMGLQGTPLCRTREGQYQFIHKSFQEFFASQYVVTKLLKAPIQLEEAKIYWQTNNNVHFFNQKLLNTDISVQQFMIERFQENELYKRLIRTLSSLMQVAKEQKSLENTNQNAFIIFSLFIEKELTCYSLMQDFIHDFNENFATYAINCMLLNHLPEFLKSIANKINRNILYQEFLDYMVQYSKHNPDVSIAAANAATILNISDFNLIGIDWSNVQIPGAQLDHAFLDYINLSGANLKNVNFSQSSLNGAILCHSQLQGASLGEYVSLQGHTDVVTSVCFSPDGKILASASNDKTVRIWDMTQGVILKELKGHTDGVTCVDFSSDGTILASGSNDKTVRIWNVAQGMVLKVINDKMNVTCVHFSTDGAYLASASWDEAVRIWDVEQGTILEELRDHTDWIRSVNFSPDGKLLASSSDDETVRIWSVNREASPKELIGHADYVNSVYFSPDGKTLASASSDQTIRVWDVTQGVTLKRLKGHANSVNSISYSPDGKILASASKDRTVRTWDVSKGIVLKEFKGHTDFVNSVDFSPDGKTLASASNDGIVRIWNVDRETTGKELREHIDVLNCVNLSTDGKTLAFSWLDNTIHLWDVIQGVVVKELKGHTDKITCVEFSPNGKILASSSFKTIHLWDINQGFTLTFKQLKEHSDCVNSVNFSPDGKMLASASDDKTVVIWDVIQGVVLKQFKGHTDGVDSVKFSPDGKILASTSNGNIYIWDVTLEISLKELKGHTNKIIGLDFSSNGKFLASTSKDNTVRIWDINQGIIVKTLNENINNWKSCVRFSPNEKFLAFVLKDNTVCILDINQGIILKKLKGHKDCVLQLTFSPDGKRLTSVSIDSTLRIWNVGEKENISRESKENKEYIEQQKRLTSLTRNLSKSYEFGISQKRQTGDLLWAGGFPYILSVDDADFTGASGLTPKQILLIRQRGGNISLDAIQNNEKEEKEEKEEREN